MEFLIIGVVGVLTIALSRSLAPRLRVASPLILVLVGVGISLLPWVPDVQVNPDLVLEGVLPPLLYAAAVSTPAMDFRRDFRLITGMSVVLVAVSAVALGFLFHALVPGLPLAAGVALGAIVSPTDAVATSIVREAGVSSRLTAILEGESLLNDATALALLRSAAALAVIGVSSHAAATASAGGVVWDFVLSVAVATGIGYVVGHLNLLVRGRIGDSTVNTVLSFAVPFIASIPATMLDASGLVAAVVAGLVTGHGAPRYLAPAHRASETVNWRTVELVLEGAVFLLMGLELSAILHALGVEQHLVRGIAVAVLALGAVLVVRAAYVAFIVWSLNRRMRRSQPLRERLEAMEQRLDAAHIAAATTRRGREGWGMEAAPSPSPERMRDWERRVARVRRSVSRKQNDLAYFDATPLGWREGGVLTWAGMRGVVTVVAAQTLPIEVPRRNLLVFIAFVVAALSLLVQGGTLAPVVRWLRPVSIDPVAAAQERERLDELLLTAGREALEDPDDPVASYVRARMVRPVVEEGDDAPSRSDFQRLRLRALQAQREELMSLRDDGAFSSEALSHALAELDAQQIALEVRAAADVDLDDDSDARP